MENGCLRLDGRGRAPVLPSRAQENERRGSAGDVQVCCVATGRADDQIWLVLTENGLCRADGKIEVVVIKCRVANFVASIWRGQRLAGHPVGGVIAFPLWSRMCLRKVDVPKLGKKYGNWEFRTKHELGVALMQWFMQTIKGMRLNVSVWLAVDGAYAARPFLLPILKMGVTIVSRLRKAAVLYDLPTKLASQ